MFIGDHLLTDPSAKFFELFVDEMHEGIAGPATEEHYHENWDACEN